MDYPTTVQAFLTVASVALFGGLVGQWVKHYLADWRYTGLVVLALCIGAAVVAQFIDAAWNPAADSLWDSVMIGFFGASLATFGYETLVNIAGKLGVGDRA